MSIQIVNFKLTYLRSYSVQTAVNGFDHLRNLAIIIIHKENMHSYWFGMNFMKVSIALDECRLLIRSDQLT